jgi:hypothetical protein
VVHFCLSMCGLTSSEWRGRLSQLLGFIARRRRSFAPVQEVDSSGSSALKAVYFGKSSVRESVYVEIWVHFYRLGNRIRSCSIKIFNRLLLLLICRISSVQICVM